MYSHLGIPHNALAWEDWKKWKCVLLENLNVDIAGQSGQKQKAILDVGCGNGAFLEIFHQKGWKCTGIDFSDFLDAISFPAEMEIMRCSFEDAALKENYFDMVAMLHTLEHFADPLACLTKAGNALKNNGYLLIELPLAQDYCGLYHQSFFTKKSIHRLLQKCGMLVVKETTYEDKIHVGQHYVNYVLLCQKSPPYSSFSV
jgi:ubiquinone/menaquinone biosynthesis C-methylase UbiE